MDSVLLIHSFPLKWRLTYPSLLADGLAYSALLKNELLGAGIEKVQDPQSEDRRLQPSTPAKRSLFSVLNIGPYTFCWNSVFFKATRASVLCVLQF